MIDPQELDNARADFEALLPDEATIQRLTRISDGAGGYTDQWADLATVGCRIAPVGGGETGRPGGRIADATTHVLTIPAGQDVTESDRVVVAGRAYDVTMVRERGGWELARRVELKEAG